MKFVINDTEITIDNHHDFIKSMCSLSEADADTLMLDVIRDEDKFKCIFDGSYAFRAGLKGLPEKYAKLLQRHVLGNPERFQSIISNYVILLKTLEDIPVQYADEIIAHVFNYSAHFQKIFDSHLSFISTVNGLPEKYSRILVTVPLKEKHEFERLFNSKYAFEALIQTMSDKYKDEYINKIVNDPAESIRLVYDLETLQLFLGMLPAHHAISLLRNFIGNREVFQQQLSGTFNLQRVVTQFPEEYAREIIQRYDSLNIQSALHLAARYKPELIPALIKLGSRPIMDCESDASTFYYLLGQKNCPIDYLVQMIEMGANPNSLNCDSSTCLHKAAESSSDAANRYIPLLLQMGVDPTITNNRGVTALQLLLQKKDFTEKDIDPALALIQHGDKANTKNSSGKNILQLVYQLYPQMKAYILKNENVDKDKIDEPAHVFSKINLAQFRMTIQHLSAEHIARKNYINVLLWLVFHRHHKENKDSFFLKANSALLLNILKHLDFTSMGKSREEGLALADYVFGHTPDIIALTHTPGGISFLQQPPVDKKPQFTLFQSARTLTSDFVNYKEYLRQTQHRRNPWTDKLRKKEFTNTSLRQIEDYRNKHSASYLRKHLSLFQNKQSKLVLLESVEQTELYKAEEPGSKKPN